MNGIVLMGLFGVLYFAPTITAAIVRNRNTIAIAALNTFLGWTMIGWVVALVWALMAEKQ